MVLYILSSLKIISPFIYYNLNQEYIINVLCENKSKPELKCKGKCFLKKELKKSTEENDKNRKALNFNIQLEFPGTPQDDYLSEPAWTYQTTSCKTQIHFWIDIPSVKEGPPPKA